MPKITRKSTFGGGRRLFRATGKGINAWENVKWSAGRPSAGMEWDISVLLASPVTILTFPKQ
jgi:hypothetical protein